jgi:hypothetical protein
MRRILIVPVLLSALVLAAACGRDPGASAPSDPGTSPTAGGSAQQFASCMRSRGQSVPDPDPESGNVALTPPVAADRTAWDGAMQACRQYLPGGGDPGAPDPQQLEGMRQYALCMRQHGIQLTDPDPNTGKSQLTGRLAQSSRDQIQNDPTYKAADTACQDKLTTGIPPKGAGK